MPIIIADDPATPERAARTRRNPAIITIAADQALRQDARPVRVMLLNLSASKLAGDLHIARLLGNTPIQVELTLLRTASAGEPEVSAHLLQFYRSVAEVQDGWFDALVVLGMPAPLQGEEALGNDELDALLACSAPRVRSQLFVGGAARSALAHLHGLRGRRIEPGLMAVYPHQVLDHDSPLLRGHDRSFDVPVNRSFGIFAEDVASNPELTVLAAAPTPGIHLLHAPRQRQTFMFNDIGMDGESLRRELRRTRAAGTHAEPAITLAGWQAHVHLFFANWLAHDVMAAP